MSGDDFLPNLSPKNRAALDEMKKRLADHFASQGMKAEDSELDLNDEPTVLRFLRARDFNLNQAFDMAIECLNWRKNFKGQGASNMQPQEFMDEIASGKCFFFGRDKEGRPICVIRVRLHKLQERDLDKVEKFCVWTMERGRKLLKPPEETVSLVFDLTGFSITQNMDYPFLKFLITMFEKYYPESLGVCLVLNAPWIFWGCWKVIRPWIPPKTEAKVKFVNTKQLLDYVDSSNLLNEMGGTSNYVYEPPEISEETNAKSEPISQQNSVSDISQQADSLSENGEKLSDSAPLEGSFDDDDEMPDADFRHYLVQKHHLDTSPILSAKGQMKNSLDIWTGRFFELQPGKLAIYKSSKDKDLWGLILLYGCTVTLTEKCLVIQKGGKQLFETRHQSGRNLHVPSFKESNQTATIKIKGDTTEWLNRLKEQIEVAAKLRKTLSRMNTDIKFRSLDMSPIIKRQMSETKLLPPAPAIDPEILKKQEQTLTSILEVLKELKNYQSQQSEDLKTQTAHIAANMKSIQKIQLYVQIMLVVLALVFILFSRRDLFYNPSSCH